MLKVLYSKALTELSSIQHWAEKRTPESDSKESFTDERKVKRLIAYPSVDAKSLDDFINPKFLWDVLTVSTL